MAPAPRFGIVLPPEALADLGGLSREVEDNGFDWLGVADSRSVCRELYVALTVAAAQIRHDTAAGARQFIITGFVPDSRVFLRRWMREVAAGVNQRSEVSS